MTSDLYKQIISFHFVMSETKLTGSGSSSVAGAAGAAGVAKEEGSSSLPNL